MIYVVLMLLVMLFAVCLMLYSMATKRIVDTLKPEDVKTVLQKMESAKSTVNELAEKQKQEVTNATAGQLVDRVRLRLVRGSSTSTTTIK